METANCKHCGKEMTARSKKQYCSGSCRAKASVVRSLGNIPQVKTQDFAIRSSSPSYTPQHDPASAFIIDQLKSERDRWKKEYDEERATAKKLKEKNEELEKKITSIENEHRISAIESAKPSGLNGILKTEAGSKLIEMCAPLIQRMLEPQPAPAQMTGTDGHQSPAAMFEGWFNKLSMPTQQTVWRMLQAFTIMPDGELKEYAASVIASIAAAYPNTGTN